MSFWDVQVTLLVKKGNNIKRKNKDKQIECELIRY